MRQSTPGQKRRNQKSNSKSMLSIDKKQPTNIPAHDPAYAMQYGCSRKTGQKTGGHFWNPPAYCGCRIVPYGGNDGWMWAYAKNASGINPKRAPPHHSIKSSLKMESPFTTNHATDGQSGFLDV